MRLLPSILLWTLLLLGLTACAQHRAHQHADASHSGGQSSNEWTTPWRHRHASANGTPYVHAFGMEPAFLGRDLLVDAARHEAPGEVETEIEAELEWAFTERVGVAVELPFARVEADGESAHSGVGDFAIAPRAVLFDSGDHIVTASLGLSFATGDVYRDLGAGEGTFGPALSTWSDLGNCVTLQARLGTTHGMESGDITLDYHAALIWSIFDGPADQHVTAGMVSLLFEFGGRTILDGPDETRTTNEVLFGGSYAVDERLEFRVGYLLPVGGPEDLDFGILAGAIYHF